MNQIAHPHDRKLRLKEMALVCAEEKELDFVVADRRELEACALKQTRLRRGHVAGADQNIMHAHEHGPDLGLGFRMTPEAVQERIQRSTPFERGFLNDHGGILA